MPIQRAVKNLEGTVQREILNIYACFIIAFLLLIVSSLNYPTVRKCSKKIWLINGENISSEF